MSDWTDDDTRFKEELRRGHKVQEYVAKKLSGEGLDVVTTPLSFRKTFKDRKRYQNEIDLVVGPHRLEVKGRKLTFSSVSDYPFETALVDTVKKWNGRDPKPLAMVLVSTRTGCILAVFAETKGQWTKQKRYDNVREFTDTFFEVPKESLVSYEALVARLQGRTIFVPKTKLKPWYCHHCQERYKMRRGGDYCIFCSYVVEGARS